MQKPRIAITGLGTLNPLANTVQQTWQAIRDGKSGIGPITQFDASAYTAQIAGEVKNFDPATTGLEPKDLKKADRFIHLGLSATAQAMQQAGLSDLRTMPKSVRERTATILGTGIGGLSSTEGAAATITTRGPSRLSPFFIPAMLPNLLAGQAAILYGAQGPNVCPVSACATSAHALGWAMRLIRWGEADIVIAGGAEATVCPTAIGGFAAMRALSTGFNATPERASQPFNAGRDGFILSEGAATLILEREDHAKARGAQILGYISGFGQTCDAANLTLPSEGGEGAQRAMQLALTDAGLQAADIAYINAHATSTPLGDDLEAHAITQLFGSHTPISSTKGHTGHLLGAAGALEAILTLQTLHQKVAPATRNLTQSTATGAHILTQNTPLPKTAKHALSNSFGFGGTNAALIISID